MSEKAIAREIINLVEIMSILRSPTGCPWDKVQTPETLKPFILEEAYELLEAIDNQDEKEICNELGDLLLQVVFIAQMFSEQNKFGLADVARAISKKLQRRHPHVFSNADADKHAQVWEEIKQQERSDDNKSNKLKDRIPINLPALKKATKVAKKINGGDQSICISNLQQKTSRLSELLEQSSADNQLSEILLGDILFGVVQLSHSLKIDAEDLLRKKTIQVMNKIDI